MHPMQELAERLHDRVPDMPTDIGAVCDLLVEREALVSDRELFLIETLAEEQGVGDEHLDPVRARRLP